MPDYPTSTKSKFLTEEERILACNRLALDGIGLTQGAHGEKITEWQALKMAASDWRTWMLCFLFVLGTGSQTMQYFVPSLVKTFGWKGNTAQCKFMEGPGERSLQCTDADVFPTRLYNTFICVRDRLHIGILLPCRSAQDNLASLGRFVRNWICLFRCNHSDNGRHDALCTRHFRLRNYIWVLATCENMGLTCCGQSSAKASGCYCFDQW